LQTLFHLQVLILEATVIQLVVVDAILLIACQVNLFQYGMSSGKKLITIPLEGVIPLFSCGICSGYLIDAVSLLTCSDSFCRSCFLKYIRDEDSCPLCGTFLNMNKLETCFKNDEMLQSLIYKLVPRLLVAELKSREEFYEKVRGLPLNLKPSLQYLVGDEIVDEDIELLPLTDKHFGLFPKLCAPNDPISFGFEFPIPKGYFINGGCMRTHDVRVETLLSASDEKISSTEFYFTAPAMTRMSTLKKLLMTKFSLHPPSDLEIVYGGEIVPSDYSLSDVIQIFLGGAKKYLHFYFQAVTPRYATFTMAKLSPEVNTAEICGRAQKNADEDVSPMV
ncbi:hypothetical protein M514_05694, partial [Trichuris suis]